MTLNGEDSCDIDMLTALLDEEEVTPSNSASPSNDEASQLKKKLEEMEKQMAQLKEQLNMKNQEPKASAVIKDVGLNFTPTTSPPKVVEPLSTLSAIHNNESDSSEDEDGNRTSYNQFGQFVKQQLAHKPTGERKSLTSGDAWINKEKATTSINKVVTKKTDSQSDNGFTDPFFGIKILNPLIGSLTLQQRMEGRKQIKLSLLKMHMRGGDIKDDWVTMGVVVSKSDAKTSQKGKKFAIWKLCDLKDCTKLVTFFLFGDVFTTHWKMAIGSVIGILNPNFMKEKSPEEISFTVDHHQKVLHIGSSKDLGFCKATRKDGSRCPSYINKSECEFCVYHVQNEFKKTSAKRSEIQSSFSGTGLSTQDRLKQKVLGKQEVFYGGQLFSGKSVAPPASKAKDRKILDSLKIQSQALQIKEEEEKQAKLCTKSMFSQRLLNPTAGTRNLLRCLEEKSSPAGLSPKPNSAVKSITAKELLQEHKKQLLDMKSQQQKKQQVVAAVPQLGRGLQGDKLEIDLSLEIGRSRSRVDSAKLKALRLVKLKGPLKPSDPNNPITKPNTCELREKVRKRVLDTSGDSSDQPSVERPSKRSKEELEAILNSKSSHADLIDELEVQQGQEYFSKMEKKEQLETKMLNTFEVKTTAVSCLKCKYTALSASELCRREGHPVRTIKAVKRFFQCKDCRQRTISLDRLPKRPCSCGSSNWERAAMGKERKGPTLPHEQLQIRGEELKNLNS